LPLGGSRSSRGVGADRGLTGAHWRRVCLKAITRDPFHVGSADQGEVDRLWSRLCDDGSPERCGWLKDRYGVVSWQIVPTVLGQMLSDPDPAGAQRVMRATLQMIKLDIAALEAAYAGGA
jgi:hypothetical protein